METGQNHKKDKDKRDKYLFNPYEMAFCGKDSLEKNIFFQELLGNFSPEFEVGAISDSDDKEKKDFVLEKTIFLNYEMVFFSSKLNIDLPKIVYINNGETINSNYNNVIAYAGTKNIRQKFINEVPFFNINELTGLKSFILNFFRQKMNKIPLYGLVLSGGKSSRMKTDKSLLKYHNKTQTEFLYDLISPFCEKVFISDNLEQNKSQLENYAQIHDQFLDFGPTGGILTAMNKYPDVAWLVMACDLPYVDTETIRNLIENRNPFKFATAYKSINDGFPEPLCTIYEPKSKIRLFQFLGLGYNCPRKVLINSEIKLLEQINKLSLINVNLPDEHNSAMNYFKQKEVR